MRVPLVHLNGTSGEALLEQYRDAAAAVRAAIDALIEASPHGRDYYPLEGEALKEATTEHLARLATLCKVRDELEAIALNVYRQIDVRDACRQAAKIK